MINEERLRKIWSSADETSIRSMQDENGSVTSARCRLGTVWNENGAVSVTGEIQEENVGQRGDSTEIVTSLMGSELKPDSLKPYVAIPKEFRPPKRPECLKQVANTSDHQTPRGVMETENPCTDSGTVKRPRKYSLPTSNVYVLENGENSKQNQQTRNIYLGDEAEENREVKHQVHVENNSDFSSRRKNYGNKNISPLLERFSCLRIDSVKVDRNNHESSCTVQASNVHPNSRKYTSKPGSSYSDSGSSDKASEKRFQQKSRGKEIYDKITESKKVFEKRAHQKTPKYVYWNSELSLKNDEFENPRTKRQGNCCSGKKFSTERRSNTSNISKTEMGYKSTEGSQLPFAGTENVKKYRAKSHNYGNDSSAGYPSDNDTYSSSSLKSTCTRTWCDFENDSRKSKNFKSKINHFEDWVPEPANTSFDEKTNGFASKKDERKFRPRQKFKKGIKNFKGNPHSEEVQWKTTDEEVRCVPQLTNDNVTEAGLGAHDEEYGSEQKYGCGSAEPGYETCNGELKAFQGKDFNIINSMQNLPRRTKERNPPPAIKPEHDANSDDESSLTENIKESCDSKNSRESDVILDKVNEMVEFSPKCYGDSRWEFDHSKRQYCVDKNTELGGNDSSSESNSSDETYYLSLVIDEEIEHNLSIKTTQTDSPSESSAGYETLVNSNHVEPLQIRPAQNERGQIVSCSTTHSSHIPSGTSRDAAKDVTDLLIHYGTEISNRIVCSYQGIKQFRSAYYEWIEIRQQVIRLLEDMLKHISESTGKTVMFKDILKKVELGCKAAALIPHPTVSAVAKIGSVVTGLVGQFFSSPNSENVDMDQLEVILRLQQDIEATFPVFLSAVQCSQTFEDTRRLVEEFHISVINKTYDKLREDREMSNFLKRISNSNPVHYVYYERLQKCYTRLRENAKSDMCSFFLGALDDYPDAIDTINRLNWKFDSDGFDGSASFKAWEEIKKLVENSNPVAVTELTDKFGHCALLLTKEQCLIQKSMIFQDENGIK